MRADCAPLPGYAERYREREPREDNVLRRIERERMRREAFSPGNAIRDNGRRCVRARAWDVYRRCLYIYVYACLYVWFLGNALTESL